MQRLDLPDAVLLHVLVLVRAFAPIGVAAVVALQHDSAPARLRGQAVGRERDNGHHLQVLVEVSFARALAPAAERPEVLAYPRLADIDAVERELDRSVVGE